MLRITDLHEDIAYSAQRYDVVRGNGQSSISMLSKFESAFVLSSIFPYFPSMQLTPPKAKSDQAVFQHINIPDFGVLLDQMNFHIQLENAGLVTIVRKRIDMDSPGVKLLMAMEGADALRLPTDIFYLHSLGLRSLGLVWNRDNKFASSYLSMKDYGLTGSGKDLVSYCKDLGIAMDLSHASKGTITDVLSMEHGPVFISHGNSDVVFNHPRNYTDDIIGELTSQGGIIGVTGIRSTIDKDPDLSGMLRHINYIGENFGWDHVAIGSDFLGVDETVEGFENVSKFQDLATILEGRSQDVIWRNGYRFFTSILE